jgi:hypothetical protein
MGVLAQPTRQLVLDHNMATLVREAPSANSSNEQLPTLSNPTTTESDLASTVPAPFPTLQRAIEPSPLNDPAQQNQVTDRIAGYTAPRAHEPMTERLDGLMDPTEQVSNAPFFDYDRTFEYALLVVLSLCTYACCYRQPCIPTPGSLHWR